MVHWMLNCKEVSEKVSESMDRTLPLHYRLQVKMHLLLCKYCNRFKNQLLMIRGAARVEDVAEDDADLSQCLSEEACQRIKQAIKNDTLKTP